MRAAFIDLDGVIVNNDKRMQHASRAMSTFLQQHITESDPTTVKELVKQAEDLYWQTAFTPELVEMDTLMDGSLDVIWTLADSKRYRIIFLTSRPETMRKATEAWLKKHLPLFVANFSYTLVMKAAPFQFTKTITWKAGLVDTLAHLYGALDVLFIDDDQANRDEVLKYLDPDIYTVNVYASLHDAITQDVIESEETK